MDAMTKESQVYQRGLDQVKMKFNIEHAKMMKKIKDVESTHQISVDEFELISNQIEKNKTNIKQKEISNKTLSEQKDY